MWLVQNKLIYCEHGRHQEYEPDGHIFGICPVYTWYIPCIHQAYDFNWFCWSIFTGFRGKHFAPLYPSPLDIQQKTLPDPNDDADFEPPEQESLQDALIHAFLAGLSKESDTDFCSLSQLIATLPDPSQSHWAVEPVEAVSVTDAKERGLIPEASDETLQAFSYSEMKLYKHAISYKWTLIIDIHNQVIKSTDFQVEAVNVDLHKRVAAAIEKGQCTRQCRHNMLESDMR
jgi:hypothetical protein